MIGKLRRNAVAWAAVGLAALELVATSCASDPSAQYFPSRPPVSNGSADLSSAVISGTVSGNGTLLIPHGPLSRPDPKLTPGAIATTDLAAVCRQAKRTRGLYSTNNPLIAPSDQQAVFSAYKIPPSLAKHFGLDFLVPLQLGGAVTTANIWPMARSRGLGFHEKYVLNLRMHILVCHGEMPLQQAQHEMAADWIKLWTRYGG
jgi:hypothetical protein